MHRMRKDTKLMKHSIGLQKALGLPIVYCCAPSVVSRREPAEMKSETSLSRTRYCAYHTTPPFQQIWTSSVKETR